MADFTEPAFPIQASDLRGAYDQTLGLSKREYIATQILAGYASFDGIVTEAWIRKSAKTAVAQADALIAALKE